uniref:Tox-REase-5 domain-containing protein n=1 Tax=Panagrellus redivivus TaxID=6233 RepID=A0A7E4VER8_PANRE
MCSWNSHPLIWDSVILGLHYCQDHREPHQAKSNMDNGETVPLNPVDSAIDLITPVPSTASSDAASNNEQQMNALDSAIDIPAVTASSLSPSVAPQPGPTPEIAPPMLPGAAPAIPAEAQNAPSVQPWNPHMDHCQGAVNYIGYFMANNMLAYFAHDAVHYTGIRLPGQSGIDACFGPVTFLQDDTQPGVHAFKFAYERALEEKVQYAYIEGTELKFQMADYKEPWMRAYIAEMKASQQAMMLLYMDSVNLFSEVDQTLSEHGFDLFEP